MDRLKAMEVFLAAVETGSLSAAGRKLGMPLPTVSRKISELEAHLGARLLHRSTRMLALSDAGRDYLAACRRILEEVDEAERAAAGEYSTPRGDLVITAPIVFGRLHVLPLINEFLKGYPEVNVRLSLRDQIINLLDEHVDLAVRIGHLPDSALIARRLGVIRRVVCGSPDYLARRGTPGTPDELGDHCCVSFDALTGPDTWVFDVDGARVSVPIRSRLSVNTAEAAIDAATAGVGLTRVLSYQVVAAEQAGLLKRV
ncbi:MAG TPA: LysR family transcriptional regulator, partial [Xanthomonadales bacterium]|nr:LysR family transcriptional regulator [Xanthomonadales bacterium]